ncbi:MAG: dimethylmenaquinone methyltransferase protein [Acidimicrobiaceae bacterium]|nr:dimethylmenaquinone methyltransferase protein [Acidimicrobiaceae bacterium]
MPGTNDSSAAIKDQLLSLGAATLGESGGVPLHPRIRPVWSGAAVAAPAYTVACAAGDNLAIHAGLTRAPRGCVLAVSVGDETQRGYWGEVLTTAAETAGVVGLIIDGTVRDTAALGQHGFPVFARGVGLRGASKNGPGSTGGEIVIGGVIVASGDWLVADADGVVAIGASSLSACLATGTGRATKEQQFFQELRNGATTPDLLGLDVSSIDSL